MPFDTFSLADGTLDAVAAMGYDEPTPIQAATIPILLEGRDVLGQARTGTGKTAAFGIPLVDRFRGEHADRVVALVLVPTRELALQVTEVLTDIAKGSRLSVVPVYGGAGFGKQESALHRNGTKVVVATPGRLLDHVGRGTLDLGRVSYLVLDEADRMLDMGFVHDMRRVQRLLPSQRQTTLFSATFNDAVRRLSKEFTTDAELIAVASGETTTPLTEQYLVHVRKEDKTHALMHLLHEERPDRAVVFTRTKHLAKRLAKKLDGHGWSSVALQGNMTQGQRERAMAAFRDGKARLLVATDVAARGLDVPEITHVVNFDLPDDPEQYVHRIGRTGRNGSTGRAFTFVQPDQKRDLKEVEREAGRDLDDVVQITVQGDVPRGPDEPAVVPQPHDGRPNGNGRNQRGGRSGPGTLNRDRGAGPYRGQRRNGSGGHRGRGGRGNGGRSGPRGRPQG